MTVVGLGYMGLPTALLLAQSKIKVFGYDIDTDKIQKLNEGMLPFEEKGLIDLFHQAEDFFHPIETLSSSDAFILTLPTPINQDKSCDISFVLTAVHAIAQVLKDGDLVILESTVAPGTTMNQVKPILEKTGKRFFLSYVSEKAIPGNTLQEMQENQRVIGGMNEASAIKTKELYERFVTSCIHITDCTTAETVKLLENTYRDVNIALANELSIRLSQLGVNTWEAIRLANFHPRVNLHQPGPGVGGHCIAIDPWFLVNDQTPLIHEARRINDHMPEMIGSMVEQFLENISDATIILLGVAYKGNVDDDRESPAYAIKKDLESKGFIVHLYDPLIKHKELVSNELEKVTKNADCLVLVTDHSLFSSLDPSQFSQMRTKKLIDTRNMLNHKDWEQDGFDVKILGID